MEGYKSIKPEEIEENIFKKIGSDWMLITAGGIESYNTMTASWGGMGVLWNKKVVFTFIRPPRHTYKFAETNDTFTLTFFPEQYKEALMFCGTKSGRDFDKAKETGLTPVALNDTTSFEEAYLVLECKKVYFDDIRPENFIDKEGIDKCYPDKDYHRMYIGEITGCYIKE